MDEHHPSRRVIFQGLKIDLALQTVALGDGTTAEREVILHRGAVALVPMVDSDHVCLIRNHRYAIGDWLLEVPAGTIDRGEEPIETARRELEEETGYTAGRIRHIRDWWVSPGLFTEKMSLFLCEDLRAGSTNHQPDERIEPVVVPWGEALAMIDDGRIADAKTMLALSLCDRLRGRRS